MLDNPDIKIIVKTSDPFFSSPYMGTLIQTNGPILIEPSDEQIPLDRLTPDNPIVFGTMLTLFEDELGDNGQVQLEFRFRTMADSWFALLRQYIRVDAVVVRIYDTRLFHLYTTNYILREFTVNITNTEKILYFHSYTIIIHLIFIQLF